jgi:hypothetical protein
MAEGATWPAAAAAAAAATATEDSDDTAAVLDDEGYPCAVVPVTCTCNGEGGGHGPCVYDDERGRGGY